MAFMGLYSPENAFLPTRSIKKAVPGSKNASRVLRRFHFLRSTIFLGITVLYVYILCIDKFYTDMLVIQLPVKCSYVFWELDTKISYYVIKVRII